MLLSGEPAVTGEVCRTTFGTRWPRRLSRIAALVALTAGLAACAKPACERLPNLPVHHVQGGFCNPPGSPEPTAGPLQVLSDRIRLLTERYEGPIPPQFFVSPEEAIAAVQNPPSGDTVSWLGHGTVLVRIGGRTVLADPIWSRYASSFPPFGPKRVAPPPVPIGALPPIDVLLISHNHYDHLDLETLRRIPNKERIDVIAPLGLGSRLREAGFSRVRELDWWQAAKIDGLTVWLLPAQHQSGRGLFDLNETLWASYAVIGDGGKASRVYLSGDSGYRSHFREIGERLGPFDLAVMNVGGYGPLPVANAYHVTPDEAARAVGELRARRAVPIHWGTYPLGSEPVFAPGPLFARAAQRIRLPSGTVRLLKIGETWAFGRERGQARPSAEKRPAPRAPTPAF